MGPRSRTIRISEDVFARLQKLAKPLEDTPNSVIEGLLDWKDAWSSPPEKRESVVSPDLQNSPDKEDLVELLYSKDASELEEGFRRSQLHWAGLDHLGIGRIAGTRVILAPATESAREHYEASVEKAVDLSRIKTFMTDEEWEELVELYPDGRVQVWGARSGPRNRKNFARIRVGDVVLFYRDRKYFSSYRVTKKLDRAATELARELWGTDSDGHTWDLVYFLSDARDEEIEVGELGKIAGQGPRTLVRGLWILDRAPSTRVIEHFGLAR